MLLITNDFLENYFLGIKPDTDRKLRLVFHLPLNFQNCWKGHTKWFRQLLWKMPIVRLNIKECGYLPKKNKTKLTYKNLCMRRRLAISFQNMLTIQCLDLVNRNIIFISWNQVIKKKNIVICICMNDLLFLVLVFLGIEPRESNLMNKLERQYSMERLILNDNL